MIREFKDSRNKHERSINQGSTLFKKDMNKLKLMGEV
jgi:hypothetical protein